MVRPDQRLRPDEYTRSIERALRTTRQVRLTSGRSRDAPLHDIGEQVARTPPCNCTIFAYAHLRKCAGVTVRTMMAGQGDEWKWSGYCVDLRTVRKFWSGETAAQNELKRLRHEQEGGASPLPAHGPARLAPFAQHRRWFLEVHCNPDLPKFVQGLRDLRQMARQHGCQLYSSITLRDPARMVASDFEYFVNEHEKRGLDLAAFARRKPEYLLLGSGLLLGYKHFNLGEDLLAAEVRGGAAAASAIPAVAVAKARLDERLADLQALSGARRRAGRAELLAAARKPRPDFEYAEAHGRGRPRRPQLSPDFKLKWWGGHSAALQAAQLARAELLDVLKAHGLLSCERLLQRADELLAQIDLVGFVERMAPTVLQLVDALGLQHMPSALYSNKGYSKPQADTSTWAAMGLAVKPPTAEEKRQLSPALRAWNNCSTVLYRRWLDKFDARVAAMPPSFHERLARVPTERPVGAAALGAHGRVSQSRLRGHGAVAEALARAEDEGEEGVQPGQPVEAGSSPTGAVEGGGPRGAAPRRPQWLRQALLRKLRTPLSHPREAPAADRVGSSSDVDGLAAERERWRQRLAQLKLRRAAELAGRKLHGSERALLPPSASGAAKRVRDGGDKRPDRRTANALADRGTASQR